MNMMATNEAFVASGEVPTTKPQLAERAEWRRFANWALVWLGLGNVLFIALWAIGAPPRAIPIIVTGTVGLAVRRFPRWLQFIAFVGVLGFSVLWYIAGVFNLAISSLLYSIQFMIEMKPAQSFEYVASAGALLALLGGAWLALRRDSAFTNWRLLVLGCIATLSLALLDAWMNIGMRGHYERMPVAGAPFESAMNGSGAEAAAIAGKRNLVVVIVESLGVPVENKEMQRLLFKGFDDPVVKSRYDWERGTTLYYNSTTSGEVRELCGRWGDYYELVDKGGDPSCLPARMKRAGYSTHAMHSFAGFFFKRQEWYPGIGFEESRFADRLFKDGAEACGGVFPGVCDRDVPVQIGKQLKSSDKPQLVYWLTVNTHLPVPTGANLDVEHCERTSAELAKDFPMICRQFSIWLDVERALSKVMADPDLPPTDFVIVGDHMPPYFERRHRKEFAPDRVPWLYLRWKGDASQGGGK